MVNKKVTVRATGKVIPKDTSMYLPDWKKEVCKALGIDPFIASRIIIDIGVDYAEVYVQVIPSFTGDALKEEKIQSVADEFKIIYEDDLDLSTVLEK